MEALLGGADCAISVANAICADCHAPNPQWASTNLGVLLCVECAGCHRALGPHISQVRSLTLDSWDPTMRMLLSTLQSSAIVFHGNAIDRRALLWAKLCLGGHVATQRASTTSERTARSRPANGGAG